MITITVPGKIILFGEYAVCHGTPGLSIAVDKTLTLTCDISNEEYFPFIQVRELFMMALKLLNKPYTEPVKLTLESDIPTGKGYGSSSALCVAIAAAAFEYANKERFTNDVLYDLSFKLECEYFKTTPSGIDTQTCINGGCIVFQGGKVIEKISETEHITVSMYDTNEQHKTVCELEINDEQLDRAKSIVQKARENFKDIKYLAELSKDYQQVLRELNVSKPSNEDIIIEKNDKAKISGSGNGGIMIAFGTHDNADEVLKFTKRGIQIKEHDMPLYLSRLQYQLRNQVPHDGFASAPANIALIKYWGKTKDTRLQEPLNPNVSLTLSELRSYTDVKFVKSGGPVTNTFTSTKLESFLKRINPFGDTMQIQFDSKNNFPTGCGIASSASGFCALVGAIGDALDVKHKLLGDARYWFETWARLGSGSACRSMYGGIVSWDLNNITQENHKVDLVDIVVVFDPFKKEIASSLGHSSVDTSLFQKYRLPTTHTKTFKRVCTGLKTGNVSDIVDDVELDSMLIHAIMQTAQDKNNGYLNQASMGFIEKFITFRNKDNIHAMFTFDAGPNPHIIVDRKELSKVKSWILSQTGWNSIIINRHSTKGMILGKGQSEHCPEQIFKHRIRITKETGIQFQSARHVLAKLKPNQINDVYNVPEENDLAQIGTIIY